MFVDQNLSYDSSQQEGGDSSNFSFSSDSSVNSVYTPQTRRQSFGPGCMESGQFVDYGSIPNGGFSMTAMPNDDLSTMPNMLFSMDCSKMQADAGLFNFDPSFMVPQYSHHGLQVIPTNTPSLVPDLQSPISELGSTHSDYINPSHTFLETYDVPSPSFVIKYESPASAYTKSESPCTSYMSFSDEIESCSTAPSTTTPLRSSPLRQPIFEPLQSSIALHRIQNESQERKTQKKLKRQGSIFGSATVRFQPPAKKECPFQNCGKKFQRQEHLKRHEKTHTNTENFVCEFCPKRFGRSDNLKSHIALHADPNKKSARTKYFPEAMAFYERLNKKKQGTTLESKLSRTHIHSP
jgi:zinc finger protein BrlA